MPIVGWKELVNEISTDSKGLEGKVLLNVSTSTYYKVPSFYTLLNAVIYSKLGVNQVILIGRLKNENFDWKDVLEDLLKKVIVKINGKIYNKNGAITFGEFPNIRDKSIVDILSNGKPVDRPFVWEEDGKIKRGKNPSSEVFYTNGVTAHTFVIALLTNWEKMKKFLNCSAEFEKIMKNVEGVLYGCGDNENFPVTVYHTRKAKIFESGVGRKIKFYVFPEFSVVKVDGRILKESPVEVYKDGELVERIIYRRENGFDIRILDYIHKSRKIEIEIWTVKETKEYNVSNSSIQRAFKDVIPKYQVMRVYL